ncbi:MULTISPECIES: biliverdin-producing heme oxygenase [Rhodomicrobium]|uniref:biliverdin-producing heme oxygenase n=1 Tax=Rhodomicrobium TaxID=1068 RepID=UPI001FD9454E|nr:MULTISPECIES: biliverdin-producing heme oxygenase [Rhodomicrobium]
MPDGIDTARLSGEADGLLARIRARTDALHREAERTGVIGEILRGTASVGAYALLLRNLLPVYEALEAGLERWRGGLGPGRIALPALYRSAAIGSDLMRLHGTGWREALPVLAAAECYAAHVGTAATGDGAALIAHAYVRSMGDLSGGQILKRLLSRTLRLPPEALAFYDFPAIADVPGFKADYRAALERAASEIADPGLAVDAAAEAFRLNIALSRAVAAAARG